MSEYIMQSTVSSQPPRQICTHFGLFCSPPPRESRVSGYSWRSQFGITCWGFEWERIFKLQKRALWIMTNSKYDAHTEPIFKGLEMLKVKDISDVQCLKLWYKFVNNKLPYFFQSMFTQFNSNLLLTHKRSCQTYESYITAMHTTIKCKLRDTLKNDTITAMQNIQPLFAG